VAPEVRERFEEGMKRARLALEASGVDDDEDGADE